MKIKAIYMVRGDGVAAPTYDCRASFLLTPQKKPDSIWE